MIIDDEDFWKGPLARRTPLKRDYLACLVRALDAANPPVIALDIALPSPIPQAGPAELPEYNAETQELLATIKEVSRRRTVVLATTLAGSPGARTLNSNVFDDYDFAGGSFSPGFTTLPRDLRQVALYAHLKGGGRADSFAAAIVRPLDERALGHLGDDGELPYGTYYRPEEFRTRYAAHDIFRMSPDALRRALSTKAVIVGGGWHRSYYGGAGEGDQVDLHFTPAGDIPGAYIHANYVEALLRGARKPLRGWAAMSIDIICSAIMAVVFALQMSLWSKFGRVLQLCFVLIVLSYFLWQNLGYFFDFFIPIVLLGSHAVFEEWRESRAERRHMEQKLKLLESRSTVPPAADAPPPPPDPHPAAAARARDTDVAAASHKQPTE